ncbi:zinc finger, CCHC-type containing protein [Tanacetum coccineum]
MHFLLSNMSVIYVLTTPILEDGDNATMEQISRRNKWENDDYVCRGLILNVVNMVDHNKSSRYTANRGKCKHQDTKADPNKKSKVTCWKCGKPGHFKKHCKCGKVSNKANGSSINGSVNSSSNSLKGQNMFNKSFQVYYITYVSEAYFVQNYNVAWWVDLVAIVHVCKDRFWFKTYESLNDGSILHMGNESTTLMHGHGYVDLRFSSGNIVSLFNVLHHARLGHVHFKRMQDMSKDRLIPSFDMDTEKCKTCILTKITKNPFQNVKRETKVLELIHIDLCDLHATPSLRNKKYFVTFIDDASRSCYVYLLHTKDEALNKFKVFKTEVELQQGYLIKRFKTGRGGEYMDTLYFQYVGIIHEMTPLYTPQQNGISERKIEEVVRLPDSKLKNLGERGIQCIFVRYAEHSKAFRNKERVYDQHSYCFNVEGDSKTFDEEMKSQDFVLWKEAINDEMDSIMGQQPVLQK